MNHDSINCRSVSFVNICSLGISIVSNYVNLLSGNLEGRMTRYGRIEC